jgi:hypothetical protein
MSKNKKLSELFAVSVEDNNILLGNKLMQSVSVQWHPQPDITTYELARLIPLITCMRFIMPHDLPTEPELLRHLVIHDPNKKNEDPIIIPDRKIPKLEV